MKPLLVALALLAAASAPTKAEGPASRPAAATSPAKRLAPGDTLRSVAVDGNARTYLVHVPPKNDANKPAAVVLAFHGAWGNGRSLAAFSGLSAKADQAGFIVVYPNGSGLAPGQYFFNAFFPPGNALPGLLAPEIAIKVPDDVEFTARLLDDLAGVVSVDARRVYATGMSNGGMMCHRLAAELSDRIAAVAAVSGTLCLNEIRPKRPVPVMHFHGTADEIVPYGGATKPETKLLNFRSVEDTIKAWVKADGCPETPETTKLPDKVSDGTTVTRMVYGPGKEASEVVLYAIEGGGHTWPGQDPRVAYRGKSTMDISANDLMWEFFQKHPMPEAASQPAP